MRFAATGGPYGKAFEPTSCNGPPQRATPCSIAVVQARGMNATWGMGQCILKRVCGGMRKLVSVSRGECDMQQTCGFWVA